MNQIPEVQSLAYKIEIPGSDTSTRLTTRCFREIQ